MFINDSYLCTTNVEVGTINVYALSSSLNQSLKENFVNILFNKSLRYLYVNYFVYLIIEQCYRVKDDFYIRELYRFLYQRVQCHLI